MTDAAARIHGDDRPGARANAPATPSGAVAWLALPIPIPALTKLSKALESAYGKGLGMEGCGPGMWITQPQPISEEAK